MLRRIPARWLLPGEMAGALCPLPASRFQARTRCAQGSANRPVGPAHRFLEWISRETSHTLIRLVSEKETGNLAVCALECGPLFAPNDMPNSLYALILA